MDNTILLVEDDPDDEELTRVALQESGLADTLVVVRDGAAALDYLLRPPVGARHLPRLVLLDLRLPKVDGLEVLRRLRVEGQAQLVPVVVMTSSNEDEDVLKAYGLRANSYVRKPVAAADFVEVVSRLSTYWTALNVAAPHSDRFSPAS